MDNVHGFITELIKGLQGKRSFAGHTYTDEPILRRAAQMDSYLPDGYREMKAIARQSDPYDDPAAVFYRQATVMADFEDNCPCRDRFLYYRPSYNVLSDRQLRGYFTWRAAVRRGNIEPAAATYAFLYIFELLHLIGVNSAEEGYAALCAFAERYEAIDRTVHVHLTHWIRDFYLYYRPAVSRPAADRAYDDALAVLRSVTEHDDTAVYEAMCRLSTYHPSSARFVKDYPADYRAVAVRVYRAMAAHFDKRCKSSYFEHLFGGETSVPYMVFNGALFYPVQPPRDGDIALSALDRYTFRDGVCIRHRGCLNVQPSRTLGNLLKAVDAMMRDAYGYAHTIQSPKTTKHLQTLIDNAVTAVLKENAEAKKQAVTLDLTLLDGIRKGADDTRDKLLVEEADDTPPAPAPVQTADTAPDDTVSGFLRVLLYGGDVCAYARACHTPVSVLTEAVNDALYDEFADTVLLCDGDTPLVVDEYLADLKGRFPK